MDRAHRELMRSITRLDAENRRKDMPVNVYIIESDAHRGKTIEDTIEFQTEADARAFCKTYNSHLAMTDRVPEYYVYARMEGQKEYGMIC